jgi:hypothetical protein
MNNAGRRGNRPLQTAKIKLLTCSPACGRILKMPKGGKRHASRAYSKDAEKNITACRWACFSFNSSIILFLRGFFFAKMRRMFKWRISHQTDWQTPA